MHKEQIDKTRVISAREVADIYRRLEGNWLLLKVLQRDDKTGKASLFMLIDYHPSKDVLYELLEDDDWDWAGEYMFVFADPDAVCSLD